MFKFYINYYSGSIIFTHNKYNNTFYSNSRLHVIKRLFSPYLNIEYTVKVIREEVLEFIFFIEGFVLNEVLFKELYFTISNSNEFLLLGNVKLTLMSGLKGGEFVTIGKSLIFTNKTTEEEFVRHYINAIKILQDRHYECSDFTFLVSRVYKLK